MMRPRFSLRWLLVVFTLVTVVFYVTIVQPTAIATKFVNRVNSGDLSEFHALETGLGLTVQDNIRAFGQGTHSIEYVRTAATVKPRTFGDFFMLRRSVDVTIGFQEQVGGKYQSLYASFNLISNASGTKVDVKP